MIHLLNPTEGKIKSNVDISSPPMLDIFIKDLLVHTNLLVPQCLLYRVLQIEGEVSGDGVLVHLGRVVGWVHLGIRLDNQKGVLPKEETATDTPRCSYHLRSGLLPSHPFEGECWKKTSGYSISSPAIIRGSRPGIY